MSLEELKQRMKELRIETRSTPKEDKRKRLMIQAEKLYIQGQIDRIKGKDFRLGGVGSREGGGYTCSCM